MNKASYYGNELRIDGYYYSDYSDLVDKNYVRAAVFYRNGFCIHAWVSLESQDTLNCIENELLNDKYISKLRNDPDHIGVFRVTNSEIEFETWEYRNTTVSYLGTIVNDTTFVVNKRINHRRNQTYTENLTYKFKQFSPKPDSTSVYVK